ncbi:hypothetical protein CLAVI_000434 [Candidatus Clavichlamydia salmonicola]|nr:hypothetical protein [Candidatus Clavichlamydia salmonicola]
MFFGLKMLELWVKTRGRSFFTKNHLRVLSRGYFMGKNHIFFSLKCCLKKFLLFNCLLIKFLNKNN